MYKSYHFLTVSKTISDFKYISNLMCLKIISNFLNVCICWIVGDIEHLFIYWAVWCSFQ